MSASPVSAADRDVSREPDAVEKTSNRPSRKSVQATSPDSSHPTATTDASLSAASGACRVAESVAERNNGAVTATRNTNTPSTATIAPIPPAVMMKRATASAARAQGWVVRRRVLPVNGVEGCKGLV